MPGIVIITILLGLLAATPGAGAASNATGVDPATRIWQAQIAAGTPVAAPGEDLTCSDFPDQAAAQRVLEADPADPHGLDVDLDGIACETPIVPPRERERERERAPAADPGDGPPRADLAEPPARDEDDEPLDIDCIDFQFQEDAQTIYDRTPGDPYNLDPSGDGFACSSLPSRRA